MSQKTRPERFLFAVSMAGNKTILACLREHGDEPTFTERDSKDFSDHLDDLMGTEADELPSEPGIYIWMGNVTRNTSTDCEGATEIEYTYQTFRAWPADANDLIEFGVLKKASTGGVETEGSWISRCMLPE